MQESRLLDSCEKWQKQTKYLQKHSPTHMKKQKKNINYILKNHHNLKRENTKPTKSVWVTKKKIVNSQHAISHTSAPPPARFTALWWLKFRLEKKKKIYREDRWGWQVKRPNTRGLILILILKLLHIRLQYSWYSSLIP